jgi:hypothetical protein
MTSSILTFLLLAAADPSVAVAPATPPVAPAMAIDEEGLPVDKKTKKGILTGGPRDCDDGDAACHAAAAAACAANPKIIVDTYGGHGAHGGKPMAISEQGMSSGPKKPAAAVVPASLSSSSSTSSSSWTGSCPAPAGMAINEKGTATEPKKATKSNK